MRNTFLLVLLGFVGLAISASQEDEQTTELEEALDEDTLETSGELEELDELTEDEDESLEISRTERDADPEKKKGRKEKNGKGNAKKNKTRSGKSRGKKNKSEWGKRKAKSSKSGSRTKSGKGKIDKTKNGNKKRQGNRKAKSSKGQNKSGKTQKNKSSKPKKKDRKAKKPSTKQNTKAKTQRKSGKITPTGEKRTACSRAVNSTCLDTAVKLLKIVNSRVTNFLIQQKRMSKYNSTGGKKSGKKGLFGPIASKVIDVGGGNASDLSCSGNKTNAGATKLKSIISSLQTCEENIKTACDPTAYPLPNVTKGAECKTNMESMKKSVTACGKKTGDEACTCWLAADLKATAEKVKTCDISSENKKVTAQHKQCTGNFSACKQIEDTAVTYIYACSQSASDLKVKAAQAKSNVDALGGAKNKTSELAGSSTGRSTVIRKRATSVSTCSEFIALSTTLLQAADDAPTSSAVETMAKILSAVSSALSCTTTEKATLTVQTTTYTQKISKVTAAYNGLKSSVEDASGTTSDAEIVAAGEAASSSTKKVAAKRNRLVRNILNNLQ